LFYIDVTKVDQECCIYCKCFRGMLQLFHMDIAKEDQGYCTYCKCFRHVARVSEVLFKIFHLFQTYVASVLIWMLHMFHTYVARICSKCLVVSVLCCSACFHGGKLQVFYLMLHMFHTHVKCMF
jgi:hypothetical protein